jgi:hypothetical protein
MGKFCLNLASSFAFFHGFFVQIYIIKFDGDYEKPPNF